MKVKIHFYKSITFDSLCKYFIVEFRFVGKWKTEDIDVNELLAIFGNNVRVNRRLQKLTQEELANLIDIGIAQVKRIEAGTVNTSISTAYKIAVVLKVTIEKLFEKN